MAYQMSSQQLQDIPVASKLMGGRYFETESPPSQSVRQSPLKFYAAIRIITPNQQSSSWRESSFFPLDSRFSFVNSRMRLSSYGGIIIKKASRGVMSWNLLLPGNTFLPSGHL
jgi:hypothetical protein